MQVSAEAPDCGLWPTVPIWEEPSPPACHMLLWECLTGSRVDVVLGALALDGSGCSALALCAKEPVAFFQKKQ